jgi:hypothetical protein
VSTTHAIKAALRQAFPGIKFSAQTDFGGHRLEWVDDGTPTEQQVIDVLIGAGGESYTNHLHECRVRWCGRPIYFNRYNTASRAAYADLVEEYKAQRQREEAAAAEKKQADRQASLDRWRPVMQPTPLPPIPVLQQLSEWVIRQNEKRMPKWKFRLASDLAVQIHPQLTRKHALLFECKAIQADGVSAQAFTEPKTLEGRPHLALSFKLFCNESDAAWTFKVTSFGGGRRLSPDDVLPVRQRTLDALTPARFTKFTPDLMLHPGCMCCGKPLTDPVSMARWIGPECFGSASNDLPQLFKTEHGEDERQ